MKKVVCGVLLAVCFMTACSKEEENIERKETVQVQEETSTEEQESTEEKSEETAEILEETAEIPEETVENKVPCTVKEMNEMGINDFNDDDLYMDKVRIEDFSYLYDNGLTYEDHVSLQARLSRYLDYYIPTGEDKIWNVTVIEDDFASVPAIDLFYVYLEELDAVIECKRHKNDGYAANGFPYTFSCEKIEDCGLAETDAS